MFAVGVKSIAKMCFPCCVRTHNKNVFLTAHGKHIFDFGNTTRMKRMVSRWYAHHRGLTKMQKSVSRAAWEPTKKKPSHRAWETYFGFCNSSNGFVGSHPVLAGSVSVLMPKWSDLILPTRAGGQYGGSYHRQAFSFNYV